MLWLQGAAVVHIAPVSPSESMRLHLVAVTADGRRVYFSACEAPGYGVPSGPPRPSHLRAQVARQAPPLPSGAGAPRSGSAQPSRCVKYARLLLSELALSWRFPVMTNPVWGQVCPDYKQLLKYSAWCNRQST